MRATVQRGISRTGCWSSSSAAWTTAPTDDGSACGDDLWLQHRTHLPANACSAAAQAAAIAGVSSVGSPPCVNSNTPTLRTPSRSSASKRSATEAGVPSQSDAPARRYCIGRHRTRTGGSRLHPQQQRLRGRLRNQELTCVGGKLLAVSGRPMATSRAQRTIHRVWIDGRAALAAACRCQCGL
jgi:hypothetical protein